MGRKYTAMAVVKSGKLIHVGLNIMIMILWRSDFKISVILNTLQKNNYLPKEKKVSRNLSNEIE